jgi:probable phosphoglycerate mutase
VTTRLLLIRHGETQASLESRFVGWTDVDLTENGQEQARLLAKRLRHIRIDALYASSLRRCQQTAAAIADETGLKVRTDEDLRECHFGDWEGLTPIEVAQDHRDALAEWMRDEDYCGHNGESWAGLGGRLWGWWERASERHADRTVVAVAHGGPIRVMLRRALQAPLHAVLALEIDPCSVTVMQTRTMGTGAQLLRVRLVNDVSHLRDTLRPVEAPNDGVAAARQVVGPASGPR